MARFACYSTAAMGLSWWRRLHDEGHEVLVYIEPSFQKKVGENLVPRTNNAAELLAWAKAKPGTIAFFDFSDAGHQADAFRKAGIQTVCGGGFCDRLERDREFGARLARICGVRIPPTKEFSTVSQAQKFIATIGDDEWYWKSDRYLEGDATCGGDGETLGWHLDYIRKQYGDSIPNIVQKKIDGVAISTACWFNGNAFVPPYMGTIEHKRFLNDDIGPTTGCAVNVVWAYDNEKPRIVSELCWEAVEGVFRAQQAPPGLYDINSVVNEEGAWFLEWTPRMGWDSEATSQRLLDMDLGDFFARLVSGRLEYAPFSTKDLAYGVKLSVSPYPWECTEGMRKTCEGAPIHGTDGLWDGHFVAYSVAAYADGELYVADRNGALGVGVTRDWSLRSAHKDTMDYLHTTLHAPGLQYRTDGASVLAKDAGKLRDLGYDVPAGVLR